MRRIGLHVINLDRDVDRLAHMEAALGAVGLAFERFSAVQGIAVPTWLKDWFFDASGMPVQTLKPGEIGVYASHLSLHRQLLEDDRLDWLLVMEDDLEIEDDLPEILKNIAADPPVFDILKLSNPAKSAFLDHGEIAPGRSLVSYARVPNNLGAYLISRRGAEKTTRFRGLRRYAIDEDMRHPWNWQLVTYGILPAPVRANIFDRSSIDAMGDRGLGREKWSTKFRRRHFGTPTEWIRKLRWQFDLFGVAGYIRAISAGIAYSIAKRISGWQRWDVSGLLRINAKRKRPGVRRETAGSSEVR